MLKTKRCRNSEKFSFKNFKNVMFANDEKRKYIHLTAVFACNFVNHLFARAKEISDSQDIPFEYFLPLIDETTENSRTRTEISSNWTSSKRRQQNFRTPRTIDYRRRKTKNL
jgi:hypothetical protein